MLLKKENRVTIPLTLMAFHLPHRLGLSQKYAFTKLISIETWLKQVFVHLQATVSECHTKLGHFNSCPL